MSRTGRALVLGIVWLLGVWTVALVAERSTPWLTGPNFWSYDVLRRVTPLTRWDSGWYLGIAESGYGDPPTRVGQETNHAFFPLYPLLMRIVMRSTGIETSLVGNLISAACLLGSLVLLASWTARHFGEDRVGPTLLAFLLFPTSFFFASVYTEALVVLLTLLAITSLERDRPIATAICGYLSGLTRITGVVVGPYLFLSSVKRSRDAGKPWTEALLRGTVLGAMPLLGFATFCLYFQRKFGNALLFMRAQHNWSREDKTALDGPMLILKGIVEDVTTGHLFHKSPARTLEGVFLALFAFLAYRLFRDRRPIDAFYVAAVIGLVPFTGTLESAGRYVLPAFPAFAVLASLHARRSVWVPLLVLSALIQASYIWIFVHWLWAG